ncbi:hypothetical protein [Sneathiella aquimaris]|uniref:hypothetical protein n=1 Tax=Sneathiella aquimaris TaxID=2599305 RepID=UPI00146A5A0E|nr:hypothetical protein [Sneathiella aquimaris]
MLQKQLEEAATKTRQSVLIFGLSAAVILLAATSFFLFSRPFSPPEATGPQSGSQTEVKAGNSAHNTQPKITELKNPAPAAGEASPDTPNQQDVLTRIAKFEEEIEPSFKNPDFKAWSGQRSVDLKAGKEEAINSLALGDNTAAHKKITRLIDDGNILIQEFEGEFEAAMDNARTAFKLDAFQAANEAIENALTIKSKDPQALDLQEKIKKLPEILSLMEQAEIAQTENNLQIEYQHSLKIAQLDPSRNAYAQRAAEIEALLLDQKYEDIIVSGHEAYENSNLAALKQTTRLAASLFPERAETKALEDKLLSLKRQTAFNNFLSDAQTSITDDNWEQALNAFKQAQTLNPDDQRVVAGITLSTQIAGHINALQSFNANPERLASKGVLQNAEKRLEQSTLFKSVSAKLKSQIAELDANIAAYNTPLSITVLSDGLTDVSVRGVGQVGIVSEYVIKLKPGTYRFEGKRKGYKTKSVSLTLLPNTSNIQVKVIADERI